MLNFQILTELRFFKTTVDIIKFVHENEHVRIERTMCQNIESKRYFKAVKKICAIYFL